MCSSDLRILEGELASLERRYRCWRIATSRVDDARAFLTGPLGLSVEPADRPGELDAMLNGRAPEEVLRALTEAGLPVRSFAPEPHWLDRLFLKLTRSHETDRCAAERVA